MRRLDWLGLCVGACALVSSSCSLEARQYDDATGGASAGGTAGLAGARPFGGQTQRGGAAAYGGTDGAGGAVGSVGGSSLFAGGSTSFGSGGGASGGRSAGGASFGGTTSRGGASAGGATAAGGAAGTNCPALAAPANGSVMMTSAAPGATATYTCKATYAMSGESTRTCQPNGAWSGSAPTCNFVDCRALSAPTNGTVSYTSTTFGSRAEYFCNRGYGPVNANGNNLRFCDATGVWSGQASTCEFCNFTGDSDTLAFWRFATNTGQTVSDSSGNALDGRLGTSTAADMYDPQWTQNGRFEWGLSFTGEVAPGEGPHVYVPTGLPFTNNRFTVEIWVKPNQGYAQIFTAGFITLYVSIDAPRRIQWAIGDGNDWTLQDANVSMTVGSWHLVSTTYDGSTMKAYLNGTMVASQAATVKLPAPTEYYLGGRRANTFLNGTLGPIRLSSTAHTAAQIQTVYRNASGCVPP